MHGYFLDNAHYVFALTLLNTFNMTGDFIRGLQFNQEICFSANCVTNKSRGYTFVKLKALNIIAQFRYAKASLITFPAALTSFLILFDVSVS